MLAQIPVQVAFFLAATLTLLSVVIATSLFWKMRTLRQELDDQGVKLIQLTNLQLEAKKDIDSIKGTMASVVEHLEKTHVKKSPIASSAPKHKERDDEPTEKLPPKLVKQKTKAGFSTLVQTPQARQGSAAGQDGDDDTNDVEVPTNVKFKDGDAANHDVSDDATSERSERPAALMAHASMRELSSSDFDLSQGEGEPSRSSERREKGKEEELKRVFSSQDDFVGALGGNVTKVGMFYPTRRPYPVGTRVEFQFRLEDGTALMGGKGEVKRAHPEGMEIRFIYVDPDTKAMIRQLTGKK